MRSREEVQRILDGMGVAALARTAGVSGRDAEALASRLRRRWFDAYRPLAALYGHRADFDGLLRRCVETVVAAAAQRSDDLRGLDHRREIDPDWFLREDCVGYVAYVDRFAGTVRGIEGQIDYLSELGVSYLHLMPLLQSRPGENDGGYAVSNYREVDSRLGSMDDLEHLAGLLREHSISLCVDLVVNHTAQEHVWARKAAAGDAKYRDYYFVFDDREWPDRYERSLPEVFPDTAPGNFTWFDDVGGWVWTTFHDYQWDLNYGNPDVFVEMLEVMAFLANRGVEILRLDAVPFTWKREGTDCQNQPEAHLLLQAYRALIGACAPALIFKAEAIVSPDQLVGYLGTRDAGRTVPECELAYHNQLMVMSWSAVATRDARLAVRSLSRMPTPPAGTSWVTYVRGHDDIGWAVTDEDAGAVGWDGAAHRRFLAGFFAGEHPGSFAVGAKFQEHPVTGARTSGMAASLAGIEQALVQQQPAWLHAGIRRLLLLYGIAASYGGIPLIYMGDELALCNDAHWDADPEHARDNRWLHRPPMDPQAAARRSVPGTVEQQVFDGLRRLLHVRRATPQLRSDARTLLLEADQPSILAFARFHPREGSLLVVANVGDSDTAAPAGLLERAGLTDPADLLSSEPVTAGDRVPVPALSLRWLVDGD